jgi:hypothetical protein
MIDFSTTITDFEGKTVKDNEQEVTLRLLSVGALSATYQDEQNLSPTDKFKRGDLATKIYNSTEPVALKSEDVTMLKTVIGKAYGPLIVYKAYQLLDAGEKTDA